MARRDPPGPGRDPAAGATRTGGADRWLIVALVLVALALRLRGIGAGLPQVYEEAYPYKIAWGMWGWGPDRALDLNPHWFKYPGLTIDLQFLGQGLLYLGLQLSGAIRTTLDFRVLHYLDPTLFLLVGRSITACLGALTVVPVFLLARRAPGRGTALVAAALAALNPALIAKSQVIEVDVPLTLFVAASLLAAVRLAERLTWSRVIAAGVLTGLAASTKYPGLVLAVPCAVAVLLAPRTRGPEVPRVRAGAGARRRPPGPRAGIGRAGALAALAALGVATLFTTSPFLFLDLRAALADLAVEGEHMRLGHFGSDLGPAWASYLRDWPSRVAGWPVALASLVALVLFVGPWRRPWAPVVASFVLAYAALVSSFAMKADRYLLPLLPAAFVFAAALASEAAGRWAGRAGYAAGLLGTGVVLALPALAALPGQLAGPRPDSRTLARAWFEANVPSGAFVASEPYGPPLMNPLEFQALDRDLIQALRRRGEAPKLYALVSVPMFQVAPERSARFYHPALYRVADVFVVTGSARDRYRREPGRFAAQLAFYDTLGASWELWKEFPSAGGPGPDLAVYRNPAHREPFSRRRPHPGEPPSLPQGPVTGGEAYFHYNLGINYELFGFLGGALQAYRAGFAYLASEPAVAVACVERAAGVLVRAGRREDAVGLLERAEPGVARPADRERLRQLRDRLVGTGGR